MAVDGRYGWRATYEQFASQVRIEADGYLTAASRDFKSDEGNVTFDFRLTKAEDPLLTVLTPDGHPAGHAKVALGIVASQITVKNGEIDDTQTFCDRRETNEAGSFRVGSDPGDVWLVITHPSGFAQLKGSRKSIPKTVRLLAWAQVEGTLRIARKLQPRCEIWMNQQPDNLVAANGGLAANGALIVIDGEQTTDLNGRFVVPRAVPGLTRVGYASTKPGANGGTAIVSSASTMVLLSPGKTAHVDFGTSGRPVVGQIRQGPEAKAAAPPTDFDVFVRPEGRLPAESDPLFTTRTDSDGSFSLDDIPPGNYVLSVRALGSNVHQLEGHRFAVPAINERLSQRPVDLGVLTLKKGG
jgi:hypothetical protein